MTYKHIPQKNRISVKELLELIIPISVIIGMIFLGLNLTLIKQSDNTGSFFLHDGVIWIIYSTAMPLFHQDPNAGIL